MKEYDILSDAEKIIARHKIPKPKWLDRKSWNELSEETRYLWSRIEQLKEPVHEAYLEALRDEDWQRALELVLCAISKPMLPSVNRVLYPEHICRRREAEFANKAKNWLSEAERLLSSF